MLGGEVNYGIGGAINLAGANPSQEKNQSARQLISDGTYGTPRIGASTEPQSLGINFIIKY